MTTALFIIDPQNDFCSSYGSLCVPGASEDMERLGTLIKDKYSEIDQIFISLDTHQIMDIAHPGFWRTKDGTNPIPFSTISRAQVLSAEYLPVQMQHYERACRYLQALELSGKYHMIWPVHCVLGDWGHNLYSNIASATKFWTQKHQKSIIYIQKGFNQFTEHFSAIRAEVSNGDPSTQTNTDLLYTLYGYDKILVAGEASSHCVKSTIEDLVKFKDEMQEKIVLIKNCMSAVSGFKEVADNFMSKFNTLAV